MLSGVVHVVRCRGTGQGVRIWGRVWGHMVGGACM